MNGEMRLNQLRQRVYACWQLLPFHFSNLNLDAFVVMPNHIHGILVLTHPSSDITPGLDNQLNPPRRGAALDPNSQSLLPNSPSNATPDSDNRTEANMTFGRESIDVTGESEPGVAFGRRSSDVTQDRLPNAAPLPCLVAGSVGAMVLNFKSVTTRLGDRMRRSPGRSMWQRNYYEHIIRHEKSLHLICQYVYHNPISWQQDQLHPGNPSRW